MKLQNYRPKRRKGETLLIGVVVSILACLLIWACVKLANYLPDTGYGFQTNLQAEVNRLNQELQNATAESAARDFQHKQEMTQQLKLRAAESLELHTLSSLNNNLTAQLATVKQENADALKYWLVIGIPTVPRRNETDYLTPTLASILDELPLDSSDILYKKVKIIVMNNRPHNHSVYTKITSNIASGENWEADLISKARIYVQFLDNAGNVTDPTPDAPEPDDLNNPKNLPGRQVRRQTCDLITLLEMSQHLSHYYMFMEDDFRVCPNMMRILAYTVQKLNAITFYKDWLGLRLSYGMNGILLKNQDLPLLTSYLRLHTARLPPDLLWVEFYQSRRKEVKVNRRRKLAVYRFNLLEHMGEKSSFSVRVNRPDWPKCFDPMSSVWSLGKSESFNERLCVQTDISPCPVRIGEREGWLKFPIRWPKISGQKSWAEPLSLAMTPVLRKQLPKKIETIVTASDTVSQDTNSSLQT